jgi:glutamyl-tRNA synthetase
MTQKRIRVRFAPSPTGPLHMGGVRTALYNYLFAKKHGGDFVLRIEDTDQGRFVPGAEEYIIEALKWCGIEPNEGLGFGDGPYAPYRQSERKPMFRQYAEQLVNSGHAYYAFDTTEEMDALRKQAEANKQTFSYDSRTRMQLQNSLTLSEAEVKQRMESGMPYVIRLKVPQGENIHINDLIRGEVVFQSDLVDDKVLLKSDGMPTYHLAHIVDDYLMKITHAVRGEEWLPSAPAHVLIYRYLGWENDMPHYAHLPLLLKPDGNGKLSKRDGDRLGFPVFPLDWNDPNSGEKSSGYRERGYYPEAFVNMLAFLGWNPGTEQEIFTLEELCEHFSFEHIHKAGAKFDPEKAKWFNEHYLRTTDNAVLAAHIKTDIQESFGIGDSDRRLSDDYLTRAAELLKPRVQFEHEMKTTGAYLFQAPDAYDESVVVKKWKPELRPFFNALQAALTALPTYTIATIDEAIKSTAAASNVKPGEIMQLLRVIVSGQGGGVDLLGMIELLGQQEISERMTHALSRIGQ